MSKRKKIILIAIGIIIVGGLVYWFFFRSKPPATTPIRRPPPTTEGAITPGEELSGEAAPPEEEFIPEETLVRLTDFPVINPSLNRDETKILYYKKDGGDLWSSDFTGRKQNKESSITVIGMIEAIWSPDKGRASIFYLDKETKKGFIHVGTSSVALLPQNIKSFSWSPDGRQAAYLLANNKNTDLIITDNSGKNPRTVFSTPLQDLQISWITADKIALQTAPSGLAEGYLFTFSLSRRSLSRIAGGLFGLMTSWSPDGARFINTVTDSFGKNLEFSVKDLANKDLFSSSLPTLPDKCFWLDPSKAYCALALDIPAESILPDQYLNGEISTKDQIVLLDINNKQIYSVFADPQFDVSNLLVTKKQDYLFFVNRADGTLWSLKIK